MNRRQRIDLLTIIGAAVVLVIILSFAATLIRP